MAFLRKLNPKSDVNFLGLTKEDSGCCGEASGVCGYVGLVTGAPFTTVTFVDSDGVNQTKTFANAATDAATLKAELRAIFLAPETNSSEVDPTAKVTGMGTLENETGGIVAVDNGADVDLNLITDVTIVSVNGVAMTEDCTTQLRCVCQIDIITGAAVGAVDLVYNGGAAANLATGIYNTGDAAVLQADALAAATAAGAVNPVVTATEDLNAGTFTVKITHSDLCETLTWGGSNTTNCGCSQEFHI